MEVVSYIWSHMLELGLGMMFCWWSEDFQGVWLHRDNGSHDLAAEHTNHMSHHDMSSHRHGSHNQEVYKIKQHVPACGHESSHVHTHGHTCMHIYNTLTDRQTQTHTEAHIPRASLSTGITITLFFSTKRFLGMFATIAM